MISKAIVVGLGLPGWRIVEALLRLGIDVLCSDPKLVTARTVERVWGVADIGRPKAVAAAEAAHNLGFGGLLDARVGRFEYVVGGLDIRGVDVIFIPADRPSATWTAAELCIAAASPSRPLRFITANVGDGAAQARIFTIPSEREACPICGAGTAFRASFVSDMGFSCDNFSAADMGAGDRSEGTAAGATRSDGDVYSIPFGAAEGNAAAALALAGLGSATGRDITMSLAGEPCIFSSRLERDPVCPIGCGTAKPWPEVAATIAHDAPLADTLQPIAREQGLDMDAVGVRFLRPISLGAACGCGAREGLEMLVSPCPTCGGPVAPLRGWAYELPLSQLTECGGASAASMGLPSPELMLLDDGAARVAVGTGDSGGRGAGRDRGAARSIAPDTQPEADRAR